MATAPLPLPATPQPWLARAPGWLFASYAGSEVLVDSQELLILSEDDILAVVG